MRKTSGTADTRWIDYLKIRQTDECTHEDITETANYGLQRTVCGDCGHVSVGYLHDIFEGRELDSQRAIEEAATSS